MDSLRICLLGRVEVTRGGEAVSLTPVPQLLLAYLVLQPQRPHPRSVLAALLWGDRSETQANNCLNTALWRLRSALEPEGVRRGTYLVTRAAGDVTFNPASDYWLDSRAFEECARATLGKPASAWAHADAQRLDAALDLYRGDLLEGCYDDWALHERERLRDLHLRALAGLADYHKLRGDYDRCIGYAQSILARDPLREEVHRELMWLFAATGRRALAARQYAACRDLLQAELGLPPMPETEALAARILGDAAPPAPPLPPRLLPARGPADATVTAALAQLRDALLRLEANHTELGQAVARLEQLLSTHD
jgi:DNA-binding SARP family transcriptional activator